MKYKITEEFRQFIRELRTERQIPTIVFANALGKKSSATYNNIENSGLNNSLKNIELDSIYKIFCVIGGTNTIPYNELSYEQQRYFSETAQDMISLFKEKGYAKDLKQQLWLLAFEMTYKFFDIPQNILDIFKKYEDEKKLDAKTFILELNKNNHLASVRGFKETNDIEIKADIEGNYLEWVIKYNFSEEDAKKYVDAKSLPYHMIYNLLFNCYYFSNSNKGEVSRKVCETLKENGIYVLTDYIKSDIKDISVNNFAEISRMVEILNSYAKNNSNAQDTLDKMLKNMDNDFFFEIMSMPIFATLIHFTPEKIAELKDIITKDITSLL